VTAILMLALLAPPPASLDKVRAEPKLEKRSELAIDYAGTAVARARKTVSESGSRTELDSALKETVEACQLALDALRETGKRPNKLSRQYKRAEMRTRQFVKELTDLALAPDAPLKNRCGTCTACADACPARAIRGVNTDSHYASREEALHFQRCRDKILGEFAKLPHITGGICGVCVAACPFGRGRGAKKKR